MQMLRRRIFDRVCRFYDIALLPPASLLLFSLRSITPAYTLMPLPCLRHAMSPPSLIDISPLHLRVAAISFIYFHHVTIVTPLDRLRRRVCRLLSIAPH